MRQSRNQKSLDTFPIVLSPHIQYINKGVLVQDLSAGELKVIVV